MDARVIVAHDVSRDAAIIGRLLSEHGYETRNVTDCPSLIALASSWRPGAAVIDLELPEACAFDAARSLRERFSGEIQLVGFTQSVEAER